MHAVPVHEDIWAVSYENLELSVDYMVCTDFAEY